MSMSNKTYDTLKWIAQYLLPAAGLLIVGMYRLDLGAALRRAGSRDNHGR